MTIKHCEAGARRVTLEVVAEHVPVLLLLAVLGFADADAVASVADGLVVALPHWLSPLKGYVSAHLRRHWCDNWSQRAHLKRPNRLQAAKAATRSHIDSLIQI